MGRGSFSYYECGGKQHEKRSFLFPHEDENKIILRASNPQFQGRHHNPEIIYTQYLHCERQNNQKATMKKLIYLLLIVTFFSCDNEPEIESTPGSLKIQSFYRQDGILKVDGECTILIFDKEKTGITFESAYLKPETLSPLIKDVLPTGTGTFSEIKPGTYYVYFASLGFTSCKWAKL